MCGRPHLMVPVGEGSGEPNALMCSSCCCIVGMLILRGDMWGRSGRGGREGCSLSLCSSGSSSDINWILITVLGKRNTHLESRKAKEGEMVKELKDMWQTYIRTHFTFFLHPVIILSRRNLSCCQRRLNRACAVWHPSDSIGPQTSSPKPVVQNFFLQPSGGESIFFKNTLLMCFTNPALHITVACKRESYTVAADVALLSATCESHHQRCVKTCGTLRNPQIYLVVIGLISNVRTLLLRFRKLKVLHSTFRLCKKDRWNVNTCSTMATRQTPSAEGRSREPMGKPAEHLLFPSCPHVTQMLFGTYLKWWDPSSSPHFSTTGGLCL